MKRLTAKLRSTELTPSDVQQVAREVQQTISSVDNSARVHYAHQDGNIVYLEIESEVTREELTQAIKNVEASAKMQVEVVGWGWIISKSSQVHISTLESWKLDPLASAEGQDIVTKIYVRKAGILVSLLFLVCIFFLGLYLVSANMVVIGGPICAVIGYRLLLEIATIQCDIKHGLRINYWLRPSVQLDWGDICEMQVANSLMTRGKVCHIQRCQGVRIFKIFPIMFAVSNYYGFREEDHLLKTIISNANLLFVYSNGLGEATYRRFDAR